jgi:hypothetical protein
MNKHVSYVNEENKFNIATQGEALSVGSSGGFCIERKY